MQYIQLDNFNGNLSIVCKDDGSGEALIFDDLKEAESTLEENCQDGQVIPLGINIIGLIRNLEQINSDQFEPDEEITIQVDDILQLK